MKSDRDWIEIRPSRNAVIIDVRERGQMYFSIECVDDSMQPTLEKLAREIMAEYTGSFDVSPMPKD